MAKIVEYNEDVSYLLELEHEDVKSIVEISNHKKKPMPDVVIACFHAGLNLMLSCKRCPQN